MSGGQRAVHQVIAAASPGDAITDQALRWRERLGAWGYDSLIVAEHVHPALAQDAIRLDRSGGEVIRNADALLLHYSIWSRAVEASLDSEARVAVIYHNVTPGHLLRDANPDVALMCDDGRRMLGRLRGRVNALIAVSEFNAKDLRDVGLGDAAVVPLLLDEVSPPASSAPSHGDPILLTVGRVVPNKRLEDAIRITALLQRAHAPGAALVIVGTDDSFEAYRAALDVLVRDLGVRGVEFTGRVSDQRRDELYASSDVYLCTSVHEGFCVPLVEALQHGLPVVARAAGAIPETLGGAGIVLADDDLAVFAEAVHAAATSMTLRAALAERGRRRLDEISPPMVERRMREALAPVLEPA